MGMLLQQIETNMDLVLQTLKAPLHHSYLGPCSHLVLLQSPSNPKTEKLFASQAVNKTKINTLFFSPRVEDLKTLPAMLIFAFLDTLIWRPLVTDSQVKLLHSIVTSQSPAFKKMKTEKGKRCRWKFDFRIWSSDLRPVRITNVHRRARWESLLLVCHGPCLSDPSFSACILCNPFGAKIYVRGKWYSWKVKFPAIPG